ncbi:hypothetical protein A0J48_021895 [Sphaerospermopsis aphanizomenoides BCCUSP55]|uniref:hypothetical protein n=1 Tax=Sphaerospermopsis aphanizomenoides TaxID=459663 RepID=UPI001903980E|nr:hypothetical protein [Sphaerospermopsis aphanizomenoides]MBK1990145.1 hypothetical protein [Sphaerospermopsis aphanizomenoides BCCUSP55]
MTNLKLKDHPVWQDLSEVLVNLNADNLIREHLNLCNYQICGYWDENDQYYETVNLPSNIETELASSSIGVTREQRFIQLKFLIKGFIHNHLQELQDIGEVILVYNENLEFIDETWDLNPNFLQNTLLDKT